MRAVVRGFGTLTVSFLLAACAGTTTPTAAPSAGASDAPTAAPVATTASICDEPAEGAATDVEASVGGFAWGPVTAKVGQVITWTNGDNAPHKVVLDTENCAMEGNIPGNGSRSLVFSKAGTFAFHCSVHGQMPGEITITP